MRMKQKEWLTNKQKGKKKWKKIKETNILEE